MYYKNNLKTDGFVYKNLKVYELNNDNFIVFKEDLSERAVVFFKTLCGTTILLSEYSNYFIFRNNNKDLLKIYFNEFLKKSVYFGANIIKWSNLRNFTLVHGLLVKFDNDIEKCAICGKYIYIDMNCKCYRCKKDNCTYCNKVITDLYVRDNLKFCDKSCYDDFIDGMKSIYSYHSFGKFALIENHLDNVNFISYGDKCVNYQTLEFKPTFGFELELEGGNDRLSNIFNYFDINTGLKYGRHYHLEYDDTVAVEIVSQIIHKNILFDYLNEFIDVFPELVMKKYNSYDSNRCGLHIHVNRAYITKEELEKINLFIEFNKTFITSISRRKSYRLDEWAAYKTSSSNTSVNTATKCINDVIGDKYRAVNDSKSKTIEFRFFNGTLNIASFMASFYIIDALILFIKKSKNGLNTYDDFKDARDRFIDFSIEMYPKLKKYYSKWWK